MLAFAAGFSCSAYAQTTAPMQSSGGSGVSSSDTAALVELLRVAQGMTSNAAKGNPSPSTQAQVSGSEPADGVSPGFRTVPVVGVDSAGSRTGSSADSLQLARSIPGTQPLVLAALPSSMSLYVGQMLLVGVKDVARVAVGNGKVMEARVVDRNLLVTALDAGESTIHLWNRRGDVTSVKVRVNVMDLDRALGEINQLTAGISGVTVSRIGERIILDGANLDPAAVRRLKDIASLYGPTVVSFATSERLRVDRMIEVQVRIVEFTKTALDNLGMRWNTSGTGFNFGLFSDIASNGNYRVLPNGTPFADLVAPGNGTTPAGPLQALQRTPQYYFGLSSALFSTINVQVQRGNAFLLAAPTLTTRSGGEAKFLSGGEIPLPALNLLGGGSVTFKQYGLSLNVRPTADGAGIISGALQAEVSSIDRSIAVQGIPGLLTRRTETEFNVNDGDTIVIAGLLSRESTRTTDGLPGLRNLPVAGWAFKNGVDADRTIETVVFLTPRVVTARDSVLGVQRAGAIESNVNTGFGDLTEDRSRPPPAPPPPKDDAATPTENPG